MPRQSRVLGHLRFPGEKTRYSFRFGRLNFLPVGDGLFACDDDSIVRAAAFENFHVHPGIATSMRTVLKSISVTTAALLAAPLDVCAGISAPGSTQRFVITPENGAVILA